MKWRIWLITVSIMLLSTVVITFTSASVYYASAVDESKNYLRVYMNCFSADDYPLTDAGAKKFSDALNGARVTFISPDGKVIGDSATGGAGGSGENSERSDLSNHSDRDEIIAALNSDEKEGFAVRSSSTLGKKMVYYCKNFDGEYLVRIAIFTDNGWLIIAKTLPTILPFFAVMLSLCVIVGIFATDFIVAPVKKLAEDACYNDDLKPKYSELQPIADVLNERGRNIKKQMNALHDNIHKLERIEKEFGTLDNFVTSGTPIEIADLLANSLKYKLHTLGLALAMEYLRNVGIDATKPDTHIRRILGKNRLGYSSSKIAGEIEAIEIIDTISEESGYLPSRIDAVFWLFCSDNNGMICTEIPHCELCSLKGKYCNWN